jgi:transcription termination/antitermination protein NusG
MLKIEENPPILSPEYGEIEQIPGPWWVAHTKSRNEKALAWQLLKWNLPYFLPLREKTGVCRGRKIKTLLPLFGGYLFFCGDESARYKALTTNRIANVIVVSNQERLIRDLTQVHRAIRSGAAIDPHPYLREGTLCRVVRGPLQGVEGIVVKKVDALRLILKVDILGQAASVQIDADMIEPIE